MLDTGKQKMTSVVACLFSQAREMQGSERLGIQMCIGGTKDEMSSPEAHAFPLFQMEHYSAVYLSLQESQKVERREGTWSTKMQPNIPSRNSFHLKTQSQAGYIPEWHEHIRFHCTSATKDSFTHVCFGVEFVVESVMKSRSSPTTLPILCIILSTLDWASASDFCCGSCIL